MKKDFLGKFSNLWDDIDNAGKKATPEDSVEAVEAALADGDTILELEDYLTSGEFLKDVKNLIVNGAEKVSKRLTEAVTLYFKDDNSDAAVSDLQNSLLIAVYPDQYEPAKASVAMKSNEMPAYIKSAAFTKAVDGFLFDKKHKTKAAKLTQLFLGISELLNGGGDFKGWSLEVKIKEHKGKDLTNPNNKNLVDYPEVIITDPGKIAQIILLNNSGYSLSEMNTALVVKDEKGKVVSDKKARAKFALSQGWNYGSIKR